MTLSFWLRQESLTTYFQRYCVFPKQFSISYWGFWKHDCHCKSFCKDALFKRFIYLIKFLLDQIRLKILLYSKKIVQAIFFKKKQCCTFKRKRKRVQQSMIRESSGKYVWMLSSFKSTFQWPTNHWLYYDLPLQIVI